MMLKIIAPFFVGLLCGALGLYFFLQGDSEPHEELLLEARVISESEGANDEPPVSGGQAPEVDEQTCEETLAMVRQAHSEAINRFSENEELVGHLSEMLERTALDRPLAFPEFLEERFQPEGVLAAMDQLMEECPDLFAAEQTVVDCAEYPCFIETPFEGRVQGFDFAAACPTLQERLGAGSTTFQITTGESSRMIYAPEGEGVGLRGFLSENEARHRVRVRMRGQERQRELAQDSFEEACVVGGDASACRRLAAAFRASPEEHLFYLQAGCDTDDAEACRLYGYHSCFTHGRCTPEAEASARQAIALDPGNGAAQHALAIILCQQGRSEGNVVFQQACGNGHEASCGRTC